MSDDFIPPPMPNKKSAEFWELLDKEVSVPNKVTRAISNSEFGEWKSGSHTMSLSPENDDFIGEDDYIDF